MILKCQKEKLLKKIQEEKNNKGVNCTNEINKKTNRDKRLFK